MQWLMLQQDKPDDFVIASGVQHSVREFLERAAGELGITLRWEGEGVDEIGIVDSIEDRQSSSASYDDKDERLTGKGPKEGQVIVKIDPRYFRPTEVESLLGDPSKAKNELGWEPKISFEDLVKEMVLADLEHAKRDELVQRHGFMSFNHHE
jgi:GDPmannose 4,6-dehydratase